MQNSIRIFAIPNQTTRLNTMKDSEILKVSANDVAVTIVDNMLFVGHASEDSQEDDVVIHWSDDDQLTINKYPLTSEMVRVLKRYLERDI